MTIKDDIGPETIFENDHNHQGKQNNISGEQEMHKNKDNKQFISTNNTR